eukprot:scaffold1127_cov160-Amphora_coffeaeformis.AAC.12
MTATGTMIFDDDIGRENAIPANLGGIRQGRHGCLLCLLVTGALGNDSLAKVSQEGTILTRQHGLGVSELSCPVVRDSL